MKIFGLMAVLVAASLFGADTPQFEVATIRPAAEQLLGQVRRFRGGPGTRDPGRISYVNVTLQQLMTMAWSLREDQVSGPSWLSNNGFNLEAKVPAGATKADLSLMLRRFIEEQFSLRTHTEKRSAKGYALRVANRGQKLTAGGRSELNTPKNRDGFPTGAIPTGDFQKLQFPGRTRLAGLNVSIDQFATELARELGTQVVNETRLTGLFDISVVFAPLALVGEPATWSASEPAPASIPSNYTGLFGAIQSQLGLRLEPVRAPKDVLVVDSVHKDPRGN
jgi:uncharacterized protein (TIGR03435 family)